MKIILIVGEALCVCGLVILQIWHSDTFAMFPGAIALLWIMGSSMNRGETVESLGLYNPAKNEAIQICFAGVLALSGFLAFVAKLNFVSLPTTENFTLLVLGYAVKYYPWALFQQLILNGYFAKRFLEATDRPLYASILTGVIFSIVHLPNPILFSAGLLGGIASSAFFLKKRNLYLIALVHVVIGITIFYVIPRELHRGMIVGPRFFR